jgi:hypothetical protein
MNDKIFLASASAMIIVPRVLRFIFWGRLRRKCCLQAGLPRTLPEAVVRKRFLALDFVLSLGILIPYFLRP